MATADPIKALIWNHVDGGERGGKNDMGEVRRVRNPFLQVLEDRCQDPGPPAETTPPEGVAA